MLDFFLQNLVVFQNLNVYLSNYQAKEQEAGAKKYSQKCWV